MAVTLAQAAVVSTNQLERAVMETFAIESPILERLPFMSIEGNAFQYNSEGALPATEFRAVNAGYTESTGTFVSATEGLVILGGDADVDRFIVQTRGNLVDQRTEQLAMKTKSLAFKFQDTFVNGDTAVDANSFNGLKKRLTGAQVIAAGVNGLPVVGASDADRHAFFDVLDAAIAAVPGAGPGNSIFLMNAGIRQKLVSSMRRLTIYDQTLDGFERPVPTYAGIPFVNVGNKADGTAIIPQTETQGTATTASSIYLVKFGAGVADGGVTGLQNGGVTVMDIGQLDTKPVFRHRIEFYCGLAVFSAVAAVRVTGVLNA